MKFEIKHRYSNAILFSVEIGSMKLAVEAAVKSYADLSYANLSCADLSYADLSYANLSYANLRYANLRYANLSCANLRYAEGVNAYRSTPLLMLMDQPGNIRAYKLVAADGRSPIHSVKLTYEIGKSYEILDTNTSVTEDCGAGINLATLPWCIQNWTTGYRILIAEFTAKDIAAIPTCTDGKFRVFRCAIVGEKDLFEIGLMTATAEEVQG